MMDIADNCLLGERKVTKETKDGVFVEITQADMIERAKLQVDTRKWALARMSPKKYGESVTHKGDAENPIELKVKHESGREAESVVAEIIAAKRLSDNSKA